MSNWTHIVGTLVVEPTGRTQAEKTYILNTVTEHLPIVTGSDGDMSIQIIQKSGHDLSCSCDEFGQRTNQLRRNGKWLNIQSGYFIVVDGDLRDREFEHTYKEFVKWLCRLSKRVIIKSILVNIYDDISKSHTFNFKGYDNCFYEMYERPSWSNDSGYNWCEYLMWDYDIE